MMNCLTKWTPSLARINPDHELARHHIWQHRWRDPTLAQRHITFPRVYLASHEGYTGNSVLNDTEG